jgi:hypothetical protein
MESACAGAEAGGNDAGRLPGMGKYLPQASALFCIFTYGVLRRLLIQLPTNMELELRYCS